MTSRRTLLRTLIGGATLPSLVGSAALDAVQGSPRAGSSRTVAGLACCWCRPGTFVIGSPADEAFRRPDEARATVRLTRGFWMAAYETTQRQWRDVMGEWPDELPSAQFGLGDDVPVHWVRNGDAEAFCAALTRRAQRDGTLPDDLRPDALCQ